MRGRNHNSSIPPHTHTQGYHRRTHARTHTHTHTHFHKHHVRCQHPPWPNQHAITPDHTRTTANTPRDRDTRCAYSSELTDRRMRACVCVCVCVCVCGTDTSCAHGT